MGRIVALVLCIIGISAPLYAKEVTSEEIRADLSNYTGRTVTMSGNFIYSEPMRESITLEQNSRSVEVFYRDLPKNEKDFILALKNFSKAPITVTGVVQPYTNRPNAFFLSATSLPGVSGASDTSTALYAKEMTSAEILSDLPHSIGRTVTMSGLFIYSESMRESFTLDQNSRSIEVFYRDLSKGEKKFILAQKNFSKEPITVTGVVQPYANRANAFFLNATSLPGSNNTAEPARRGVSVHYSDIVSNPDKYVGKTATISGIFMYSEPMRESFMFDQNGGLMEVFFRDLPKKDKDLILSQRNNSKVPVIITGIVQQFTNKANTYFMNASSVSLGQQ